MRGEYLNDIGVGTRYTGSPPHARRILEKVIAIHGADGITSACAENTTPEKQRNMATEDHLRMRGEYNIGVSVATSIRGSPPHARRIPLAYPNHF
ncbi:hypothetical protein FD04_GL001332 [Secundilactobacillus odoratitofui DSM 19909 = JCM 15043]|uniref:Uncharacterized protein n=1 Tax=Secundilactobacillus odoratitofui DSM 19909 = JCM 15043 TaxID=1423776 RepID=A0A0R1LN58_9LACO|nr:hypothetical protein FD04_GL001332 [Secundilactobacillus odoratitofui DSM 19909 = JCM 15043]